MNGKLRICIFGTIFVKRKIFDKTKTGRMIKGNLRRTVIAAALIVTIAAVSCDPSRKYEKQEKEEIEAYLAENNTMHFVRQPSGLYYLEVVAGTGLQPVRTDSAYVKYTGMFLDGRVFDSNVSSGSLYGFIVGQNIVGFDEGITHMKAGGKSTLLIPSELGYGASGYYTIPGYTPLLFEIELVKVVPYTGK
jgi:FKBP-type peptidyl-prolyl cis-trans isomerase